MMVQGRRKERLSIRKKRRRKLMVKTRLKTREPIRASKT